MGEFSIGHWIVVFIVALLIFGPSKLPELGKSLGQGIREFKKATQSLADDPEDNGPSASKHAATGDLPQHASESK